LFGSGVLLVASLHRLAGGGYVAGSLIATTVVVCGSLFVAVQCVEYAHLHFTVTTAGGPGNFYILTCLHGSHVLVGLCLLYCSVTLGGLCSLASSYTSCEGGSAAGSLAVSSY
jgi:heme/copper-type cytochrome/quinol oxidase subunit 3